MLTRVKSKKQPLNRHLRLRGNSYYAQRAVPKHLVAAYSKSVIEISLKTADLIEARIRRDLFLANCNEEFRRLEATAVLTPDSLQQVQDDMAESPQLIRSLKRVQARHIQVAYQRVLHEPWRNMDTDEEHPIDYLFGEQAPIDRENAARLEGILPTKANNAAIDIALLKAETIARTAIKNKIPVPNDVTQSNSESIDAYLEQYFERVTLRVKQVDYCRKAISELMNWLIAKNLDPIICNVTRELVGDYIAKMNGIGSRYRGSKTINNQVSALSSYWRYLKSRDKAKLNPFEGQSLSRGKVEESRIVKRAFTNEEMKILLSKGAPPLLSDCIRLLALHGMRVEELCQLRAGDCKEGIIRIYGGSDLSKTPAWHRDRSNRGKSRAARREFPLHSAALSIVNRRMAGKRDNEYLIEELKTPKNPISGRSKFLGKMFSNFRKRHKVDPKVKGQSQSQVDMHSFRRWFCSTAIEAKRKGAVGFDEWTLAEIMGHDRKSLPLAMTMVTYAGPTDPERKKACIESVRLPLHYGATKEDFPVPPFRRVPRGR